MQDPGEWRTVEIPAENLSIGISMTILTTPYILHLSQPCCFLTFHFLPYERVGSSSHSFEQGAVGSQGSGGTINRFYSAEEKLNGLRV